MTVNSNYSSYSAYGASTSSRPKPNFEEMAQQLLDAMDTDGNGTIDEAEFTTAAESSASDSGSSLDATSITNIFNTLDSNSDGSMSTEELVSALQNMKPPEPPQGQEGNMPPPPGGMPPPPPPSEGSDDSSQGLSLEEIFSSLDTNQDGTISSDELMALFGDTTEPSSDSSSTTQTESQASKISADWLQKVLSYYGSSSSTSSNSSSLLNLSA